MAINGVNQDPGSPENANNLGPPPDTINRHNTQNPDKLSPAFRMGIDDTDAARFAEPAWK